MSGSTSSSTPSKARITSKTLIRPRRWYFELQDDVLIEVQGPSPQIKTGRDIEVQGPSPQIKTGRDTVRVKKEYSLTKMDAESSVESSALASVGDKHEVISANDTIGRKQRTRPLTSFHSTHKQVSQDNRNIPQEDTELLSRVKVALTCSLCLSPFEDPVTTSCGHSFCGSCLGEWFETIVSNDASPQWTPTALNEVLNLGLDVRTSVDAFRILKYLTTQVSQLKTKISSSAKAVLEDMVGVDKSQLLGPRFTCPACRATLVTPPVRSFLAEGLLKASGVSHGYEAGLSRNSAEKSARGRGKGREVGIEWSKFFGERSQTFSGYKEPEEFWLVGASLSL